MGDLPGTSSEPGSGNILCQLLVFRPEAGLGPAPCRAEWVTAG